LTVLSVDDRLAGVVSEGLSVRLPLTGVPALSVREEGPRSMEDLGRLMEAMGVRGFA
jgi:hypothetical protein